MKEASGLCAVMVSDKMPTTAAKQLELKWTLVLTATSCQYGGSGRWFRGLVSCTQGGECRHGVGTEGWEHALCLTIASFPFMPLLLLKYIIHRNNYFLRQVEQKTPNIKSLILFATLLFQKTLNSFVLLCVRL